MKKYLLIFVCIVNTVFANCDFVVINSYSQGWQHGIRLEHVGGIALVPLCSDLPEELRNKYYKKYCNIDVYSLNRILYTPFTTFRCQNLLNTKWVLRNDGKDNMQIIVGSKSLKDDNTIFLIYPQDFNKFSKNAFTASCDHKFDELPLSVRKL